MQKVERYLYEWSGDRRYKTIFIRGQTNPWPYAYFFCLWKKQRFILEIPQQIQKLPALNKKGGMDMKTNTKRRYIVLLVSILALLSLLPMLPAVARRPYSGLRAREIASVQLQANPPSHTVELTDRADYEELAKLLRRLTIYGGAYSGEPHSGQMVRFIITKTDCTSYSVGACNPLLYLDDIPYKTWYYPCEALGHFGNELLGKYQ